MIRLFRPAVDLMAQYASYHRDQRNIAIHLIGVPLIVFAIATLLGRPTFTLAGQMLAPVWVAFGLTTLWYVTRGDLVIGVAASSLNGVLTLLSLPVAASTTTTWLSVGLGSFVFGWVIQGIGHYYEGKRPALVDDLVGFLVAPMFVAAECMFGLGWGKPLLAEIERRAGPTRLRDLAAA